MEDNVRVFNSYRSLFKINFKIYDFGGKVLPRAIPLDALFMTIILFFPLLPVGYLVFPAHPWVMTILIAGGLSWLLTQMDPQGKFLPVFIADLLSYLFRPKTTNLAGRSICRLRKHRLDWHLPEVIDR
ncbi:conjugal transfer protein [Desulfoscipio geothermicus]|uniref:TcpE family protein n=1 Tax=Desulfoscipio geothermicus DSM 3669 TaxID=1121426 RepID=A0A1I6DNW4_9FIRM|nr:conjugal transfer protein [Desulfoscipio geothermicus]SFR07071.1 TcpE family protein [Desulfoscipio geothermicus DSM 3669]